MSKEPIDLMSVNIDQIVVSDKFNNNNKGSRYFIGYQEGENVKPLCIILLQMSRYIKYFECGGIFLDNDVQKKKTKHYTCIACITIDSVMRMDKKNYPQVYLEECKYKIKKIKKTETSSH